MTSAILVATIFAFADDLDDTLDTKVHVTLARPHNGLGAWRRAGDGRRQGARRSQGQGGRVGRRDTGKSHKDVRPFDISHVSLQAQKGRA